MKVGEPATTISAASNCSTRLRAAGSRSPIRLACGKDGPRSSMSKTLEAAFVLPAMSPTIWLMNALVLDGRVKLPDTPTTSFFDMPGSFSSTLSALSLPIL
ncbi:hypothetical protein AJ88_40780 [Mesorhizobium amorphae CCBAU 01583]|nr:hypothetical protein AJ88_40780 [Mesorhizobium amorphae CCBAU 01583]